MIVRILGEGQFSVPDDVVDELNGLDDRLAASVREADETSFRSLLAALLDRVRAVGEPLPDEALVPSESILPPADIALSEVGELLGDEGLIPGV